MKEFNKIPTDLGIAPLEQVTINGIRHYVGDDNRDDPYPSVTSVLSANPKKKKILEDWKARVGEEQAEIISQQARDRGNSVHGMIEWYLEHGEIPDVPESRETYQNHDRVTFECFKTVADAHIDNIRMIEGRMYSHDLRVAGTADLIADFNGKLSIIDWKTSARRKRRYWIYDYFIQESAYAYMFWEHTGLLPTQLVTVIAVDSAPTQVFVESVDEWIDSFKKERDRFDIINTPNHGVLPF